MNRLTSFFQKQKDAGRKTLVGYLMAGDPDADTSFAVLRAACRAGVDVLELGVPFSDPTADGAVIQAAAMRALAGGMNLSRALDLVRRLRAEVETPIVLFSYYNPLLQYGLPKLGAALRQAGIDGLLVVDLPPEESDELTQACGGDLPLIRLVAPTTRADRLPAIAQAAGGFLYLITRTGVTGGGELDPALVARTAARVRQHSSLPLCFGFGIHTAADLRVLAPLADGLVVGSALVQVVAGAADAAAAVEAVTRKITELRSGLA